MLLRNDLSCGVHLLRMLILLLTLLFLLLLLLLLPPPLPLLVRDFTDRGWHLPSATSRTRGSQPNAGG